MSALMKLSPQLDSVRSYTLFASHSRSHIRQREKRLRLSRGASFQVFEGLRRTYTHKKGRLRHYVCENSPCDASDYATFTPAELGLNSGSIPPWGGGNYTFLKRYTFAWEAL
jgi:hypothetical protein